MSRVTFKQLLIADIGDKKAKIIKFEDGKNLLTSTKNHLGKSMICKALYHTLGAEVFFSDTWSKANAVYSLVFKVDNYEYTINRKGSMFNLYDNKGNKNKFFKVKNLLSTLNKLFDIKIMLIEKEGNEALIDSSPVFMYTPYYIDQENGWTPETVSFDRLKQFDKPQRRNALYYHLGCLNEDFINLSLQLKNEQDSKNKKEKELEQCIQLIEFMQKIIQENGETVINEEELNNKVSENKDKLNTLIFELEKLRNKIIETENEKIFAEKERETIVSFIKKEKTKKTDINAVKCPQCDYEFDIDFKSRFRKEYIIETINEEISGIVLRIAKCTDKLEKNNQKYVNLRNELKKIERLIVADEDLYNTYIKTKSAKYMIIDNQKKIGALQTEINTLKDTIKILEEGLKKFNDKKKDADLHYQNKLSLLFSTLNVSNSEVRASNYVIGDEISASGAYKDRVILAKYYAFLQTKTILSKNTAEFPLIIDSPRGDEQDKSNTKIIMDFILNDKSLENQIIVSTIDGHDFLSDKTDINVIELSNEKHSLLNSECYEENNKLITNILLDF